MRPQQSADFANFRSEGRLRDLKETALGVHFQTFGDFFGHRLASVAHFLQFGGLLDPFLCTRMAL